MEKSTTIGFMDDTLEASLHRVEQALVDADIEGIAPDPEGEALLRDMILRGLSAEERRDQISAYLQQKRAKILAAE